MKKFFAILLAVAMMATMSMTAFATTTIEGESGTVEVTYGVAEAYVVTIPAAITLSADKASDMEISASGVVIGYGEQLTVSVSSTNYDAAWYLVDTENADNKLEYSVKNGETAVASGDAVLTVAAGTTDATSVTLTTQLVDQATVSGTYKDTITFSVSVGIPVPAVQTFTFRGETYNFDTGMTWDQWLASEYNTDGFAAITDNSDGTDSTNMYVSLFVEDDETRYYLTSDGTVAGEVKITDSVQAIAYTYIAKMAY